MPTIAPFHPLTLVLVALLNPAVIAVAVAMGRRADQWQKLIVAGFAASLAGVALVWLAARLGLVATAGMGWQGGLLVLQLLSGTGWATLAWRLGRR